MEDLDLLQVRSCYRTKTKGWLFHGERVLGAGVVVGTQGHQFSFPSWKDNEHSISEDQDQESGETESNSSSAA